MDAGDRLQRLLLVLSYVRQHPGALVDDVARAVGVGAKELKRMIPELSLCGKPPFSPDDLIDIWIDRGGHVRVEYDQALGRPMRFTRQESLALAVALRALAASGAGAWAETARDILERLRSVLGASAVDEVEQRFAVEAEDRPAAVQEKFRVLEAGLAEQRTVEIVYYTASRDELLRRQLDPYALVQFLGSWYVVGHDHLRGEVRIFKVERVREAALTAARFTRPAGFDAQQHLPGRSLGAAQTARIRFRPDVARLVADEHPPARITPEPDGGLVLELDFARPEWVAGWVMPFGDAAEVLEPESVRQVIAARCRDALALYR